jgi:hypothetical protein
MQSLCGLFAVAILPNKFGFSNASYARAGRDENRLWGAVADALQDAEVFVPWPRSLAVLVGHDSGDLVQVS